MNNDVWGMNMESEMACFDESGWEAAQANDEALQQQETAEAFERIYRAISELELLSNMGLVDLRKDVRFLELVIWRK